VFGNTGVVGEGGGGTYWMGGRWYDADWVLSSCSSLTSHLAMVLWLYARSTKKPSVTDDILSFMMPSTSVSLSVRLANGLFPCAMIGQSLWIGGCASSSTP